MLKRNRFAVWLLILLLLFSAVSCTKETPDVDMVWMRYAIHKPTELCVWQKMQTYRDGKVEDLQALGEDEDGFLLTNLDNPADVCLAVHTVGSDDYTIQRYQDGNWQPLFSACCPDTVAFLAFRDQTVWYVRQIALRYKQWHTFSIVEQTADTTQEVFKYGSKYWYRPSIHLEEGILYTIAEEEESIWEEEESVWLHTHQGERLVTQGAFPVWYGDDGFLYVRDSTLWHYDLSTDTAAPWQTQAGAEVPIDLAYYSGDALYLTEDRQYLVYGASVEEKWLGFISTGYYSKEWRAVSLQTGKEYKIGKLEEDYDNIHVH